MGEWRDIPLIGPVSENVDDVQLDEWAAQVVDGIPVIVEGRLHIVKRPGLEAWIDLGTQLPVDGLYWWDARSSVLAVSGGRVWKITDDGGTISELTGSTALLPSQPVRFADNGSLCLMANGGRMVHTDFSTLTTMADPNAPTQVTHVAYLDQMFLANQVGQEGVRYTEPGVPLTWPALNFFSAESHPDPVVALQVAYQEIIVLGRESVEFWVHDGTTPFSRLPGASQPFGTEAPYSLAQQGRGWIWLTNRRRLVTMQGREVRVLSSPYDRVLQRYLSVDDAIGYEISIDGHPIYLLNFPTARETLAVNYQTGQWHKWGYWDSTRGEYQRYRGQSYCYARAWNTHLVGDHSTGVIYKSARGLYTDNGAPIRSVLRTGHITHGVDFAKRSNIVRVRCKRGQGSPSVANPQVMLRRRVNNRGTWTNERWKSLGAVGEHEVFIDWRRNGVYKSVQYEIVHSDPTDFVLMGASEHIDVLGR